MLILSVILLGFGTASLSVILNARKNSTSTKVWALASFIFMLVSWMTLAYYDYTVVKESLIVDGKAKYVCDKHGNTTYVLIDSTCMETFKFVSEKKE